MWSKSFIRNNDLLSWLILLLNIAIINQKVKRILLIKLKLSEKEKTTAKIYDKAKYISIVNL